MIDEIVDCNSSFDSKKIPNGQHTFRVLNVRKNGQLYIWSFSYDGGQEGEMIFFANTMAPLLKALGCTETEKGKYKLQSQVVDGGTFKAEVYEQADKDDATKLYKRLRNIEGSEIPY